MIRLKTKTKLYLLFASILLVPLIVWATDSTYNFLFATGWTSPLSSNSYPLGTQIHVSGPFKLPPDWRGTIYVQQDGVQMSGSYTVTYAGGGTVNGSGNSIPITNQGGGTERTGTFDMNIGAQPSGDHRIYVSFSGGTTCALNSIPPMGSPSCTIDATDPDINFVASKGWLLAGGAADPTYTVGPPTYPVVTVTPDPTLNFGDVNVQTDRNFTITNTGGQALSGEVTGVTPPFYCVTNCLYSVLPSESKPVTIRFAPTGSPASYTRSISFSCAGSSLACQPLSSYARTVTGNFTSSLQPPQVSICATPPCSIDFGPVNVGVGYIKPITVTNTGDGNINGTVTFSTAEYVCVNSGGSVVPCTYNLWGGESTTITIRFTPTNGALVNRNDTATFTGGTSQTLTMTSVVNNKPILRVNSRKPTDPIHTVSFPLTNANSCTDLTWWIPAVVNVGAGTLANTGSSPLYGGNPTQLQIAAQPTDQLPGFSCVSGCVYSGLTPSSPEWYPTFRYCAMGTFNDGALHSTTVEFKNNQGAGQVNSGSVFVVFEARSNLNTPIVYYTAAPTGDPGTGVFRTIADGFPGLTPFMEFGNVLVNTTKKLTITLRNTGGGTLAGTVGATGNPAFTCSSANCGTPYSLPNDGSSVTFEFSFTPTAEQQYITIVDMGAGGANGWLTLHGTGARPSFAFERDIVPAQTSSASTPPTPPTLKLEATGDQYKLTFSPGFDPLDDAWPAIYMDTDQNLNTGMWHGQEYFVQANRKVDWGAVYMYFGENLSTANWIYKHIADVTVTGSGPSGVITFTVPRSLINYPRAMDLAGDLRDATPRFTQVFSYNTQTTYATPATALDFGVTDFDSVNKNKQLDFLAINRKKVGTVTYSLNMAASPNFICVSACSGTFPAAGSYVSFPRIEFHPLAVGSYTEPITVNYNDGTAKSFTFYVKGVSNLTGVVNVPLIRIVPDSFLDMGIVAQGSRRDMDITIYNDGDIPLGVTRIWASPQGSPLLTTPHFACLADTYTAADNCNPTVPAGGSRVIKATFKPQTGTGDLYADLNFTSNAFNAPTSPVSLFGRATVGSIITILLEGSDFGSVAIGQTRTQDVVIRNTGTSDFGSGTITIVGPFKCINSNAGGLDANGKCKYNLPAGGSTTITIEFAPKTAGSLLGTMELSGLVGVALPPLTGIGIAQKIKIIETVGF